jgi:hypothetical protein
MHRQLNLSPLPKQQQHDDGADGSDATEAIPLWVAEEPAEGKAEKAAGGRAERSIHLIPLLTFLCFLLLFLCSHIPSASGKRPPQASLSTDLDADVGSFPSDDFFFAFDFLDMSSFGGGASGGGGGGGKAGNRRLKML